MTSPLPSRNNTNHHDDATAAPHVLAQQWNEEGATCIEIGKYDQAISNLTRALKYSKQGSMAIKEQAHYCKCPQCSLVTCMAFSEHTTKTKPKSATTTDDSNDGFLCRTPIRTTRHSKDHFMGKTIQLIITFNLALAHHLRAVDSHNKSGANSQAELFKVLQLYQIAYQWQSENKQRLSLRSLRFNMALYNNLGEIHRILHNESKHRLCLQKVLSLAMIIVSNNDIKGGIMDLDGFYRNTSCLLIPTPLQAAQAA